MPHHHAASVIETISKMESRSGDVLNRVFQQPQPKADIVGACLEIAWYIRIGSTMFLTFRSLRSSNDGLSFVFPGP